VISTDLEIPARALAIGAHPDDIDFGCAATLAKWATAGCEVHYAVCTDGSKGSWEPTDDVVALVATRQAEQRAAAAAVGAHDVHFLGRVDGELMNDRETRADVCRLIRMLRPTVVLGHDPWKMYRLHPDHRHAGLVTLDAIVAARDPHFFPDQGLASWRPAHLLLFEAEIVDHIELVDGYVDTKLAALLAHRSQWRSTMHIHDDPDVEHAAFAERIRARAAEHGGLVDAPAGEGFKHLDQL